MPQTAWRRRGTCAWTLPDVLLLNHEDGVLAAEGVVRRLLGRWIRRPLAIDDELVFVPAGYEADGGAPVCILAFMQRSTLRIPIIKGPRDVDSASGGRMQRKLDGTSNRLRSGEAGDGRLSAACDGRLTCL